MHFIAGTMIFFIPAFNHCYKRGIADRMPADILVETDILINSKFNFEIGIIYRSALELRIKSKTSLFSISPWKWVTGNLEK